ncbi:MAG: glycosyltransferase family 39 protein, partial [Nanoarchaeota archaeon]|nr:glycosyltransferase family 39 protein [Nanoarchaeota archaeon]
VYLLGKEVYNKKVGLIAASIFGVMPLYFFYSLKLLTEPLAICLMLLAFYFLYKYDKQGKSKFIYAMSFFLGLMFLTRYLTGIVVISAYLYLIFSKWKNKELYYSMGLFFITISPLFILGIINYGNPLGMLLTNLFDNTTANGTIGYYFTNIFKILGYFIPVIFIIGLFSKGNKKPMILFLGLYILAISLLSQHYERFFVICFPFIAIIAANGFEKFDNQRVEKILLFIFIGFNLIMAVHNINLDKDNTKFLINTAEELNLNGTIMSNSPIYFSYFSDMNVVDFPHFPYCDQKVDYYIVDNYHPRYDYAYIYYTNYLNEEFSSYNLTSGHRRVIIYE